MKRNVVIFIGLAGVIALIFALTSQPSKLAQQDALPDNVAQAFDNATLDHKRKMTPDTIDVEAVAAIDLAIADAQARQFTLLKPPHFTPHQIRASCTSNASLGIHENYRDAPAALNDDQQNIYNTTLILMPNFPKPHLCHVGKEMDTEQVVKQLLSRLKLSAKEYADQRLLVEKSSIFTAAYFGHRDAIKTHIKHINDVDDLKYSPIQYAVLQDDFDTFKYLLENGVTPETENLSGGSPEPLLNWLTTGKPKGKKFWTYFFYEKKPTINARSLRIAAWAGDIGMIKEMLDRGMPAVGIAQINMNQDKAIDILKLLLQHGASVKQEEKDNDYATDIGPVGESFACNAVAIGKNEILKLLLENGASANGVFEKHPLHCAAYDETAHILNQPSRAVNIEGIKILLDAGADPFLRTVAGKTFWQLIEKDSDKAAVLKILSERNIDMSKLE